MNCFQTPQRKIWNRQGPTGFLSTTFKIVNGSDVLVGKSASQEIRQSMSKSEWFASMTSTNKNDIAEIAYQDVLDDLEIFMKDSRLPVEKDQIPTELLKIISELKILALKNPNAEDILLKIGDLIDDENEWLPEGGED